MNKLLDRYIIARLALPFAIGVATFAVIMLGDAARQLGSILFGMRVPPLTIARFLLYQAPHAVVWSMPVGTVVAVAMAMTDLKTHGELRAMRAGGASILRICLPMLIVGLVASAGAWAINEYVVPPASRQAQAVFFEMTRTQPVVREKYNVYFRDEQRRIFHIGHMDAETNELQRIVIWEEDEQRRIRHITAANWAELQGKTWVLREGTEVALAPGGSVDQMQRFGRKTIELQRALQDYYTARQQPREMSTSQLTDLIRTVESGGRDVHELQVKLHFKYSIPLACLVFALLAGPIAYRFAEHGSFVGVVVAIVIVFLYNGVRSWTLAFGLAGALHPVLAGWTQNILFGAIGLILLLRTR